MCIYIIDNLFFFCILFEEDRLLYIFRLRKLLPEYMIWFAWSVCVCDVYISS